VNHQDPKTTALTRRHLLIAAGVMAAGVPLAWKPVQVSARQDADPLAGTVVTALSGGMPSLVPDRMLLLLRVTMEPGVVIPAHAHPGPVALYVDSGRFGTEFFEGEGTVSRAGTEATPDAAITMAPGDNLTMEPGDHLFYDGAVHTMRNDGDDELVLLISALFDPNETGFLFMEMETGTPAT
jgi:quercetin dioxygenase-like cupin family protein